MNSRALYPYTALIIDEDAGRRAALVTALSSTCNLLTASSVPEANTVLNTISIQVILCHHRIPGKNIIPLLVRTYSPENDVTRILYGAKPSVSELLDAINQGQVWRFVTDDFSPARLAQVAQEAIIRLHNNHPDEHQLDELHRESDLLKRKVEQRTRELVALNEELRVALDQIHALATMDELTGLLNRQSTLRALDHAFRQSRRYNTALACIFGNVYGLGEVMGSNDAARSDLLLSEIASRLRNHIRDVDIPCRVSEHQFSIILPHTNSEQAQVVTNRLLRVFDDLPAGHDVEQLSFAFGIAESTRSVNSSTVLYQRAAEAARQVISYHTTPVCIFPDPENATLWSTHPR